MCNLRQNFPFGYEKFTYGSFTHNGDLFMNLRPLHDRIIVRRLDEGEQKIGGIIIPDSAKEKPQQGKILAVGDGKVTEDGKRIAMDVRPGNVILFGKYSGQDITIDDEDYLIVKEDEVLAVIDTDATRQETKS